MAAAAKTHIANGADVLTGSSQSVVGSIGAAKDAGNVLWFGTQADQASLAPSLVVASQVYDWTGMLKDMIAKHKAGTLGGDVYTLTLSQRRSEDRLQPRLQPAGRRQGGRRCRHQGHRQTAPSRSSRKSRITTSPSPGPGMRDERSLTMTDLAAPCEEATLQVKHD